MANLRANRITSTETFETTGSVQFDGNGDYLSSSTIIPGTGFGTNDFTIDFWIYPANANSGNYTGILNLKASSGVDRFQVAYHSSSIQVYTDTGSWRDTGFVPNISSWTHISFVRNYSGNTLKMYANGVEKWSVSNNHDYDEVFDQVWIGRHDGQSTYLNGFISNIRIVNGTALYTKNFKPPMRELEVTPETVLLACQHKTDASHEKTGKTITVNGNAVANELTPGLLTNVVKSGGSSAITGSVEFNGGGAGQNTSYLQFPADDDLILSGDFTIELWIRPGSIASSGSYHIFANQAQDTTFQYSNSDTNVIVYDGSNRTLGSLDKGEWAHVAIVRSGSTLQAYKNGNKFGASWTNSSTTRFTFSSTLLGSRWQTGNNFDGFISNFRVIKGTALYTADFIPPTRKLKKVPGTVLLCCQDNESVTTEATGKTITSNGDPTASNFTPQVGSDGSVEFAGPTTINTENYFYLPTGDTESREAPLTGNRGIFSIGRGSPAVSSNGIDYITITSTGNAQDFGDDIITDRARGACSSYTRAVFAGAYLASPSVNNNVISYVTIQSTGNALDFGDTTTGDSRFHIGSLSNSTRGLFFNGTTPSPGINTIDYVNIATTGNAVNFGDTQLTSGNPKGCSSPTRGIMGSFASSPASASTDNIQFVTISTLGDASTFGDLSTPRKSTATCSSATRGVFAGGYGVSPTASTRRTTIDFITISSTGTASSFGDLIQAFSDGAGTSNSIRGIFAGGTQSPATPAQPNVIQYITIATTGGSTDFGDLTYERANVDGCSNGHGGLG
jgi:hypothetical protein